MLPGDSEEMNERIRQLAGQALDQVVPYTWTRLDYDEIQRLQEYFARLIVRECADFADEHNDYSEGVTLGVGKAIKQHFGVEE
jgi:hypothetical protein